MPTLDCQHCGKPFNAATLRARYCPGRCFRSAENERQKQARAGWSAERRRASNIVHTALYRGQLVRRPCESCGSHRVDAHHDDYAAPLNVRWLCRRHHKLLHLGKLA